MDLTIGILLWIFLFSFVFANCFVCLPFEVCFRIIQVFVLFDSFVVSLA